MRCTINLIYYYLLPSHPQASAHNQNKTPPPPPSNKSSLLHWKVEGGEEGVSLLHHSTKVRGGSEKMKKMQVLPGIGEREDDIVGSF